MLQKTAHSIIAFLLFFIIYFTLSFSTHAAALSCSLVYGTEFLNGATRVMAYDSSTYTGVPGSPTYTGITLNTTSTRASAISPNGGLIVYYDDNDNRIEWYNTITNTSGNGSNIPAGYNNQENRMGFAKTGNLYMVLKNNSTLKQDLLLVNTTTFTTTVLGTLVDATGNSVSIDSVNGGDIIFDNATRGYLIDNDGKFFKIDISTMVATYLGVIPGIDTSKNPAGLAYGVGAEIFAFTSRDPGEIYRIYLPELTTIKYANHTEAFADAFSCSYPVIEPVVDSPGKSWKIVNGANALGLGGTTAVATEVTPGDIVEYTITIRNSGSLTATNSKYKDILPAGVTYIANSTTLNGSSVSDIAGFRFNTPQEVHSPGALSGMVLTDTTPAVIDKEVTITYRVRVADPFLLSPRQFENQGVFTADDAVVENTCDPLVTSSCVATVIVIRNTLPVAISDNYSEVAGNPITLNPLALDTDADLNPLTVASINSVNLSYTPNTTQTISVPNGTVTVVYNGSGVPTFTFLNSTGFTGLTSFPYTISDGQGGTATANENITVTNNPPIAVNDPYTTPANTAVTLNPLTGDSAGDAGQTLTITQINGVVLTYTPSTTQTIPVTNGTITVVYNASGVPTITFTPTLGFTGVVTVPYTISDGQGGTATASENITVTNNPPIAVDDSYTTPANTAVTLVPLTGDSDPNAGQTLTITQINGVVLTYTPSTTQTIPVANGTLTVVYSASGVPTITFTPTTGFTGVVTVPYTISDGHGGTATANENVTVVNTVPVAVDDSYTEVAGNPVTLNPLALDTDADGHTLTIESINGTILTYTPSTTQTISVPNGTVTVVYDASGVPTITFTNTPGFTGLTTFDYVITDGHGGSDTGTETITVTNNPPVAVDDPYTTPANTGVILTPLTGDSAGDAGQTLTITEISGVVLTYTPSTTQTIAVTDGVVTVVYDASGVPTITFTPTTGFTGAVTIPYTISDGQGGTATANENVTVVNTVPVAVDDSYTEVAGNPVTLNPLALDTDADGHTLTIESINGTILTYTPSTTQTIPVANGTVTVVYDASGVPTITFTNTPGFTGLTTFDYVITDGHGGSDTGTETITVTNNPPVAVDDPYTTPANTGVILTPLTGDSAGDAGQTLTITEISGVVLTYTPSTTQTIAVTDGVVTVVYDASGVPTITFTPTTGFTGAVTIPYTISDGQGGTATANENVTVVNTVPVAVDDSYTEVAGNPVTLNPLALDTDADGHTLTIESINGTILTYTPSTTQTIPVANGTVTVVYDASGVPTITFTNTPGFTGLTTFDYVITDGHGGSDTGTETITVTNNPPVAVDDPYTTPANTGVILTPLTGDSAGDAGQTLTITEISGVVLTYTPSTTQTIAVTDGVVTVVYDASGVPTITFTPTTGFTGAVTIPYTISDGQGGTATANENVTVVNTVPVAVDDSYTEVAGNPVTLNPLALDTDADGHTLTIESINGTILTYTPSTTQTIPVANGTVTVVYDASGVPTITFTNTPGFTGLTTFDYVITDGHGGSDTGTETITVTNNPPVAVDDPYTTPANTGVILTPLTGDSAGDAGQTLTITEISGVVLTYTPSTTQTIAVTDGVVTVVYDASGVPTITFTPTTGFTGAVTIPYTISDGQGGTATANENVTVVNTVPVAVDDSYTEVAGNPVTLNPLALDTDADGHTLTIESINGTILTYTPSTTQTIPVANGTVTVVYDASGVPTITFTNTPGFTGLTTFDYVITDGHGGSDTGTETITVTNNPPVAVDDPYTTPANTGVILTPLTGDSAGDAGQTLTITEISGVVLTYTPSTTQTIAVTDGVVTVVYDASGVPTITFTPTTGFTGAVTIPYTISDGQGGTATANENVTVVNTVPVAVDDSYTEVAGNPVTLNPLALDTDADGHTLTIESINGTILTYTPSTTQTIPVANGTVTVVYDASGVPTITFTNTPGFTGLTTFDYGITDGHGGSDTGTETITVTNNPPVAVDDPYTISANGEVVVTPLTGDSDPDAGQTLTITEINGVVLTYAPNTTQTIPVIDGVVTVVYDASGVATITVTPDEYFTGVITIPYTISDGQGGTDTADIIVTVENTAPVANDDSYTTTSGDSVVLLPLVNDGDIDGHPVVITSINGVTLTPGTAQTIPVPDGVVTVDASGNIEFTPSDPTFTGTVTFPYTVSDGHGGTDSAVITIEVVNTAPVAVDDSVTTIVGVPVTIDVVSNDTDADGDVLTVTEINGVPVVVGTPIPVTGGTVTVNADGTVTVTPNAGYTDPIVFDYTVSDPAGGTDIGTVTVTQIVDEVVANDDAVITPSGTAVSLNLLQNDVDGNGEVLSVTEINGVAITSGTAQTIPVTGGVVNVDANGGITFVPDAGFTGTVSFPYTVSDPDGNTDTAVVTVTVVNTDPVANPDGADTILDTPVTVSPLTNDYDIDGDTLTITSINGVTPVVGTPIPVTNGTATLNADGTVTVTPNTGYVGQITFPYEVSDGEGGTAASEITVTIQTDSIAASADNYVIGVGDPIVMDLLNNDVGTDLEVTSINGVTLTNTPSTTQTIPVTNGTVTVVYDASGVPTIKFTPDAGYTGPITFPYTIEDSSGNVDSAVVNIEVINELPVALDDTVVIDANGSAVVNPLVNDSDPDAGQTLTITEINGVVLTYAPNTTQTIAVIDGVVTVVYDASGVATITVTPAPEFTGTITIPYTITDGEGGTDTADIIVVVENTAPVAVDDSYTEVAGNPVTLNPLALDTDADGHTLTIESINGTILTYTPSTTQTIPVANGTVTVVYDASGVPTITFTNTPGFTGLTTFDYVITDGHGGSDTGTETITVTNNPPVAVDDPYTTPANTGVILTPLTGDNAGDAGQTLTITEISGVVLTYTPSTTQTIAVTDGVVTVVYDASGVPTITFTPTTGFTGAVTIPYTISDGQGGTATANENVTVVNTVPVAVDDSYTEVAGNPVTLNPLALDTDADGHTLTIESINGTILTYTPSTTQTIPVANGTVTVVYDASGVPTITFTNTPGFTGLTTFDYGITDGHGGSDTGTETITVTNNPPVAVDDPYTISANGEVVVTPLTGDSDPDAGQTLTITEINGVVLTYAPNTTQTIPVIDGVVTVVYDASGVATITVTPDEYFTGVITIPYTISDGQGGTDTADIIVTVENTAPVANDDSYTTTSGDSVVLLPLVNDGDIDGHPVVITSINGVTLTPGTAQTIPVPDGVVTVDASGNIEFTPSDPTFTGTVTFPYTVSDGHGGTDSAVITIEVVNTAPVAVDDSVTTIVGVPVTIDVVSNDTDADGDVLTVTEINGVPVVVGTPIPVTGGTVTVNADGTVTVTPNAGYTDPIVFDYTVSDPAGGTDIGTVTVTQIVDEVVANDDAVITPSGTPVSLNLLQNDVDGNGEVLSVTEINGVAITSGTAQTIPVTGGVVNVDANGGITFVPDAGFTGTVSFPYTVSDPDGNTDTAVVTVTVVNTDPVANPDGADTILDTPVTVSPLTNDYDIDGDTLTITSINGVTPVVGTPIPVTNGTATLNADGTVTVTPNTGYVGQITFPYEVSDGEGGTAASEITVTIQTDSIAASADNYVIGVGDPIVMDLLNNDVGTDLEVTSINGVTLTNTPSTTQTIPVTNGTVTVVYDASGVPTITFTPDSGYTGPITFPYTIEDSSGNVDSAVVNIEVINELPVALDDTVVIDANGSAVVNPLVNDSDPDAGQTLTITEINGVVLTYAPNTTQTIAVIDGVVTVVYDASGVATITVTPDEYFTGVITIPYTISDGQGGTDTADIIVVVENTAPVANDDSYTTTSGDNVVLLPLVNDGDIDGHPVVITSINGVTLTPGTAQTIPVPDGVVTVDASGNIVFTPSDPTFTGTVTFPYTVSDGHGGTDSAVITIEVVNTAPVAVDDSVTTIVGVPVTIDVVSNDTDADGDVLTVTEINGVPVVVGTPIPVTGGTVTVNADGTVTVTPNAGYTDPIVFDYTVSDPAGGTDTGTVTVTQVNDTVVANNDTAVTESGVPVSLNLVGNDVDGNGQVLSVTEINGVAITPGTAQSIPVTGGVVNVDANGGITFVPDAGFTGTVSFPYTVSDPDGNTDTAVVTVTVVNTDPVANPDGADTILDTPVTVSPLTNDYDIDGDTLTITSINGVTPVVGTPIPVTNGTATLNADGTVTVTPNTGYVGQITFPYEVSDGEGGTAASEITVTIQTDSIAASADNYVIGVGDPVVMDLLSNDVGTGLEVTSINGVTLTNTPSTTQTIPVTNGTVTVVYDASGVPTITFTPDSGYTGPITFPYTIEDSSGNVDSAVVNIEVINELPVALDDTVVIDANGSAVVNPLVNDSDPDAGQTLTITEINGVVLTYAPNTTQTIPVIDGVVTVVYDASGVATITVTPDEYFTGVITIPYTISDGQGGTDTADIIVTVENTAPVANDDSYTTTSGDSVVLLPLVNDGDIDGHPVVITSINGVTLTPGTAQTIPVPDGVVTVDASGNIVFTPSDPTFTGTVTFPYTVSDGHGGTDSAVITIEVVNTAPVAVDDSVTTIVGVPVTIDVVSNDTDADGDVLTVTEINGVPVVVGTPIPVTGGTVTVNADGTVTVTPNAGYTDPIVFDYTVSDPAGGTDTGTVTVILVNVLVVANDDAVITESGTPVSLNLLQNDVDGNGEVLSVTEINGVAITPGTAQTIPVTGGVVNVDANGGITFVPDAGFTGTVSFPYTVSDPDGNTDTAVVTVTVVNTDPVANPDGADTILNTPVTVSPLTNDYDIDGDTLTITEINGTLVVVGTPIVVPNGTVTVNADGSVTIIPNTNYVGQITFEYTISDGNGGTSISEVTVTVQTDSLAATVDMYELNVGETLVLDLLVNDAGIGLIITSINNVTLTNTPSTTQTIIVPNGTVNIVYDANGNIVSITFIHEVGYTGPISFPYTIKDASGKIDSASVVIKILNNPPVALIDVTNVSTGSSTTLNLLGNDIETDTGQVLTITEINNVVLTYTPNTTQTIVVPNGIVTVIYDANGIPTITFTPNPGILADTTSTFSYTVSDGNGGFSTAQVVVKINQEKFNLDGGVYDPTKLNDPNKLPNKNDPKDQQSMNNPYSCGKNIHGFVSYNGNMNDVTVSITIKNITTGKVYTLPVNFDRVTGKFVAQINYSIIPEGNYEITYVIQDKFGATKTGTYTLKITNNCSIPKTGNTMLLYILIGLGLTILGLSKVAFKRSEQ